MKKTNVKKSTKSPQPVVAVAPTIVIPEPEPLAPNTPASSAPVTEIPKAKRISHLKLGPALLAQGATAEQIKEEFTRSFNSRGVTNQEWIDKRTAIYMHIARRNAKRAAKSA